MRHTKRNCDHCDREYKADNRNLKRGWGLCCSKSCAASKREKNKPGYCPKRVARNNIKREVLNGGRTTTRRTAEGYKVEEGTAYNEWEEPMYNVKPEYDWPEGWDGHK